MVDTLQDDIIKANRAQELLNDSLLNEAFVALKTEFIHQWGRTRPDEIEKRERLYNMGKAVDDVKAYLEGWVTQGIVSSAKVYPISDNEYIRRVEEENYHKYDGRQGNF